MLSNKILRAAAICCPTSHQIILEKEAEVYRHVDEAFDRELNAALEEMLSEEDGFYSSQDGKEQSPPMEDLPF